MGEVAAARHLAAQNVLALSRSGFDHIVTLCASYASHLIHVYLRLLADDPVLSEKAGAMAGKVMPFSVLLNDLMAVGKTISGGSRTAVTYAED
jgi:Fe-S oxidoreductase